MADGTLSTDYLVLKDNWPGAPAHNLSVPTDGFTGATHHNVVAAAYKVGTKIQVYNVGTTLGIAGFATFIYLKFLTDGTPAPLVKQVCVLDLATSATTVTNDPTNALSIPALPSCVLLSAMTDAYFGWFWCGGVCPEEFVPTLTGPMATAGSVALGSTIIASDLAADAIGYAIAAGNATDLVAGYTLSTDS